MREILDNAKYSVAIVIYAVLAWLWFDLNNSNSLPFIGHTDLVNGWCNPYASKLGLLADLIYFSFSLAFCIVATDIILNKIPIVNLIFTDEERSQAQYGMQLVSASTACAAVNIIIFLYEFHVLDFRFKLIGLTIALIIFYLIGLFLAEKIMKIVRPILGIVDLAENINEINNINKDNK